MTQPVHENAIEHFTRSTRLLSRLVLSVRWDEVFVLQGAPLIGASFAIHTFNVDNLLELAVFAFASCLLVAHVFVFNDWSGIHSDVKDSNRVTWTFLTRGVSRSALGILSVVLLGLSLLLFAFLGKTSLSLAIALAGSSVLYSAPIFDLKAEPIFNSLLHLVGGTLHFLLGYATFAVLDARAVAIGGFFGLVFTAGHVTHEVRDHDGDLVNGIRTNAVTFGKRRTFVAGLILFTVAYAVLAALAVFALIPRLLVLAAALYPVHLYMSIQTMHDGLSFESLRRLQTWYRLMFAVIGIMMVSMAWLT
jgi:4-hydroxybenzoate polyprenyltransferase